MFGYVWDEGVVVGLVDEWFVGCGMGVWCMVV